MLSDRDERAANCDREYEFKGDCDLVNGKLESTCTCCCGLRKARVLGSRTNFVL